MTWTKIDANMPDDPRMLRLPRSIRWMHVEGLVWCNQHATNGLIPRHALRRVTDEDDPGQAADQLIAAGLWEETDDGWNILDFLTDQPSADEQERKRAQDRLRQRRQRQHKGGDHSLCDPRYCRQASRMSNGATNDVSHDSPNRTEPNRTDPTRRGGEERGGETRAGSASEGGSASLATSSAPPSWEEEPPPSWRPGMLPPWAKPEVI